MLLILGVSVAAALLVWLFFKWWKISGYWAERRVLHDPPHPVLGSLTFLQKKNPGIWMREMYDRFKAPYFGIWLFWRPALVINSLEISRKVLVKDFDVFRNRLMGTGIEKTDPIGGLNIFSVNEPVWSSIRPRLTPVFTSSKLKSMHNLFLTKSKELTQRIENGLKANKPLEIRTLRKYPPLGWLDRICDRDYVIDDNLTISKGTTVYVNAIGMHFDPDYYPDPDRFNADRFLPENDDGTRPFMPFGDGLRNCIGMRFAYRTIWYAVAAIVLKFRVLPPPGSMRPVSCEVDKVGLLVTPGTDYYVQYVPRS